MNSNLALKTNDNIETKYFDVQQVRKDFPALDQRVYDIPLVYLDNAATTQKPQCVIDLISHFYAHSNSNVHRGVHKLSERATNSYEGVRTKLKTFINAKQDNEIIFVRSATEAINLVASSYGKKYIKEGDEIIISQMEHHANIVPWQILCRQSGAILKVIPINHAGELKIEEFDKLLSPKTKLVAITHISNALGTINPIKEIIEKSHANNTPVLIAGAQASPHTQIDVQQLDCDFYTFSSHKMYGPSGVGILYGKEAILEDMPPYQGGGDMILQVTFEETQYNKLPYKFEAGTPNIEGVIGLGGAIDYLNKIGLENIKNYEHDLLTYATDALLDQKDIKIIGTAKNKTAVISFQVEGIHPHDMGTILDKQGVAIRAGHHCAMPTMRFFQVPATTRASFSFYNTLDDADRLIDAIIHAKEIFK